MKDGLYHIDVLLMRNGWHARAHTHTPGSIDRRIAPFSLQSCKIKMLRKYVSYSIWCTPISIGDECHRLSGYSEKICHMLFPFSNFLPFPA